MAKLNLRAVADVLQRLAPRVRPAAVGRGRRLRDDGAGRLILRSRVSSASLMRAKLPTETAQALLDREGSSVEYKRADGRDVIGTLRRVPALRWAAVAEVPRAEAFRQAGGGGGAGVVLVALLVAAGLAAYVGVLIVRPLQRLSSVAAKVAAGSLGRAPDGRRRRGRPADAGVQEPRGPRAGAGGPGRAGAALRHGALTGLYNRRHLMGTLANEVQRSRRLRRTFSVLLRTSITSNSTTIRTGTTHAAARDRDTLSNPARGLPWTSDSRRGASRGARSYRVLFEVIDVRQQHRKGAPQPPRPLDLVGQRPHQVPPVVQSGERVRDGEPLQLALALPLRTRATRFLNTCGQLAYLAAGAPSGARPSDPRRPPWRRRWKGVAAGRTMSTPTYAGQPGCHEQRDQHHARATSPAGLAERFRPWHLGHRGPAQRRHPPQGADDVPPVRALVLHAAAFPIEQCLRRLRWSLARINSAELTRDRRISLPCSVIT